MKIIEHLPIEQRKLMPNLPRHEAAVMDSTAYKILVECRRKYFYRIVLGRVVPFNKNQLILDWGTYYHKFREILQLKDFNAAFAYALEASFKLPKVEPTSKFAFLNQQRFMETCKEAYKHTEKEKEQGKIKVVAVEQPFNVEIAPGLFIGGRADQIVEWNGRLWGRDFKTTTKDKATFTRQTDPNDQAMRYIMGESAIHGQEIQGIIFEAVYNAKTVGPVIYPVLNTRNAYQKKVWLEEQQLAARQLKLYREEDIWPMDTSGKCDWCEYHGVCATSNMMAQENILKSNFKLAPWDHTKTEQVDL